MKDILDVLIERRSEGRPHAVATVIEMEGSVSARTGAKAVIDENGRVVAGWVGGGCAESMVCQTALEAMSAGTPRIIALDMNDEVLGTGMPCGGSMRVYVEPVLPSPRLWILGHGRVAESLCEMAALLDFKTVVDDPMAERRRYPAAEQLIDDDWDYSRLKPDANDFVVVATQHKGDHQSMKRALATPTRYIALIASRKRALLVMDFLREEGFGDPGLARVYAPAGLDLGARTPEGMALSVLSEMVALRHKGSLAPMRELVRSKKDFLPAKP